MAGRRTARRTKSARRTARRAAGRTARRAARRTARRSARRAAGRTARRSAGRTARRVARRSAGRTARRSVRRSARKEKVDAVSDILSAAYGIRRNVRKPKKSKKSKKSKSADDFLGGIETTGPLDPAAIKGNKVVEKKAKRSGKKKSDWIDHVKAFYAEKKKTNPDYKYSQALKDAKATYKK